MTDLHARFRVLDQLVAPDLWSEIEARSVATRRGPMSSFWLLLAALVVLIVTIVGGALSSGSLDPRPGRLATPSDAEPSSARPARTGFFRTGDPLEGRDGHTATLLPDGRVLVAGGRSRGNGTGVATAELYDPITGSWTTTGSMLEGRAYHTATLLHDGRVLVVGGLEAVGTRSGTDVVGRSAELYDPPTGSWTATGSMAEARTGGAAAVLPDGRVLVAGGWGSTGSYGPKLATSELYDPGAGSWSATGSMTERRHGHSGTLLRDGTVLVAGGYDVGRSASADLYDPATGSFSATGRLPEPFLGHSSAVLPDGMVLIAGGDVPSGPGALGSAHAALYDPAARSWLLTSAMVHPRLGQASVTLADGRVLVTGGRVQGGPIAETFDSAELYDPVTGTWTATSVMTAARSGHTATLLHDGRVLIVGGTDSGGDTVTSAEVYVLVVEGS